MVKPGFNIPVLLEKGIITSAVVSDGNRYGSPISAKERHSRDIILPEDLFVYDTVRMKTISCANGYSNVAATPSVELSHTG